MRTQGLWKFLGVPIYRAHRAVIFVIAQLSSKCYVEYQTRFKRLLVDS